MMAAILIVLCSNLTLLLAGTNPAFAESRELLGELCSTAGVRPHFHYGIRGYQFGFIDNTGKMVIRPQFSEVGDFAEGLAAEPQFNDAGDFSQGLAPVSIGGQWGFIDKTGTLVIKPQFDDAADFCEGLAAVCVSEIAGRAVKR